MSTKSGVRRSVFLAMGLAGVVAACAMRPAADSPAYTSGYADGCNSGRYDAGSGAVYAKDAARMADAEYATGWRHGYVQCQMQVLDQRRRNDEGRENR